MIRLALIVAATLCAEVATATQLPADQSAAIDASMGEWLAETHAPSVSIAVVRNGELVYARAYGAARLNPQTPATERTRYDIASVSKGLVAAAILRLGEDGKLSLDDHVSKYFPDLTEADKITVRQLLSHTSGYRDFWPQHFVPLNALQPTTPQQIMDEWAKAPLDFAPGAQWGYSNTGYVVAAAIVEKVTGQHLSAYLQQTIFSPLGMVGVVDDDAGRRGLIEARGYRRYGLGPPREAAKEAAGWQFGAGQFAMTPESLAKWDISLMNRSFLSSHSYDELYKSTKLSSGWDAGYSLGMHVRHDEGRPVLFHDGVRSGFAAENWVWPNEKAAIVVFTNAEWATPVGAVNRIAFVVLPPTAAETHALSILTGLQKGTVDPNVFTPNGRSYFTPVALTDLKRSLARFGVVRTVSEVGEVRRGGLLQTAWRFTMQNGSLIVIEQKRQDGRVEEFIVEPEP